MAKSDNSSIETAAEPALERELPICDSHHHLWVRSGAGYLADDFIFDLSQGHNIVSTVAVECGAFYRPQGQDELKPVGETDFLENVARTVFSNSNGVIRIAAGIVGHADLCLGDAVAPVLEGHLKSSPSRFRGIRHSSTWDASGELRSDAPRGLLANRRFRKGLACLQRYGLSFDAWLYHPQLGELADLARALPELTIILNHAGAPLGVGPYSGNRQNVFKSWSDGMAAIAACPNVMVKLGGFGSERAGFDWHRRSTHSSSTEIAAAITPYIAFCIEKFGAARCMFESNFPVEKRANSYIVVWNAFKRITRGYSGDERRALFHDTAVRIYRL